MDPDAISHSEGTVATMGPNVALRAEAMGEQITAMKEALRRDERDGICDPH